ncbi:CBN-CLEC-62 protein [Aphelenchoides avenae]|nr:CBN-CLEC-62 protein [Aphelenchus avenae]
MKHNFNVDYVRKVRTVVKPYHIGLSYDHDTNRYLWDQTDAKSLKTPLDANGYQPWIGGHENHSANGDGVQVVPSGFSAYWSNVDEWGTSSRYMCQVDTCDTDNYCDDSIDNNQ